MSHGASPKFFLKFCKSFFSNKTTNTGGKGEVVSKNEKIATHLNN